MNRSYRLAMIVAGVAGAGLSAVNFLESIGLIQTNALTDGDPVGLRDHYLQIGRFYSRGFTTGFFFCFSLMLVAIAVGTWYDERRKQRRAGAGQRPSLAEARPPITTG
ncbi:MAG: hypothetical protein HY049_14180 [Acidobacteria bacterium]|nr:hypothetical protein [Acidobacteriota bacterium]